MPGIVCVDVVDLRVGQQLANEAVVLFRPRDPRCDEVAIRGEPAQAQRPTGEHRRDFIDQRDNIFGLFANEDRVARAVWTVDVMANVIEQEHRLANRGVLPAYPARAAECAVRDDAPRAVRRQLGIAAAKQGGEAIARQAFDHVGHPTLRFLATIPCHALLRLASRRLRSKPALP